MIKAIIFDLNGVFIVSPKLSQRFQDQFGISSEQFVVALNEIMSKVRRPDAGQIYDYWRPYFDQWGIQMTANELHKFWFSAEQPVPELIEIARQLKSKGIKLFILSNNFVERDDYYKTNFPFIVAIFDRTYFSWQTGFVKPDPQAFQLILSDNQLEPDECLYFDDSMNNVRAAQELGIHAYLYTGPEAMKRMLEDEGVAV